MDTNVGLSCSGRALNQSQFIVQHVLHSSELTMIELHVSDHHFDLLHLIPEDLINIDWPIADSLIEIGSAMHQIPLHGKFKPSVHNLKLPEDVAIGFKVGSALHHQEG